VDDVYDRVPGVTNFEPLGTNETGETYRGVDIETGDAVTVRVLAGEASPEQFDRFTSVCRAVRSIDRHPNVARLYDAGSTSDGHPYLVVEYRSRSLADLIATEGRLRWQEAVALGSEVASALEVAHRMNVVHGDVVPSNILLADDDMPRLTDFGVRALQTAPDTTGATGGRSSVARLAHTAPEVVQGRGADERSDVYSLASTLFEALSGNPPFNRSTDESVVPVVSRLLGEAPPSLASLGVPREVETAVVGAMAKDPTMRPASAELFRQELLAAARTAAGPEFAAAAAGAGAAVAARPAQGGTAPERRPDRAGGPNGGAPNGPAQRPRRRRGIDLAIGAIALIAVIAIVVAATRSGDSETATPGTDLVEVTDSTDATGANTSEPGSASTTVAPSTSGTTTTAAPATTDGPLTSDVLSTDPFSTDDPIATEVAGPSTSLGDNTLTLTGTGFHLTSYTQNNGGTTLTFPADKKYHYFDYSLGYMGATKPLQCQGHTGIKKVEGPGIANLWLGSCLRAGKSSTKIRARAYSPGKITFTLYLCDVYTEVSYCNGTKRSTNGVELTLIATAP
jgi:hypothetical protein